MWELDENDAAFWFLIRDHDSNYTHIFYTVFVFASRDIHDIPTPLKAPNANAYIEYMYLYPGLYQNIFGWKGSPHVDVHSSGYFG